MSEDELVEKYTPVCEYLARRYHQTHSRTDPDHLRSEALLAMLLAIRSFDPARSQIQTHIEYKVKKALIDYDRKYSRCRRSVPVAANTEQIPRCFDIGGADSRLDATRLSLRLLLDAVELSSPQGAKRVAVFEMAHAGYTAKEILPNRNGSRVSGLLAELAEEIRRMVGREK